jgi:hypothetical protein
MAFATEHAYLGVAFRNLRGQTLHPIVCAVWGHVVSFTIEFIYCLIFTYLYLYSNINLTDLRKYK